MRRLSLILIALVSLVPTVDASNWPRFRGPNGTGQADDRDVPVKWSQNEGVLWKAAIPGAGCSSPIVWGDRIFVQSSHDEKERLLVCLDANDGKVLWSQGLPGSSTRRHPKNSLASSTPATNGKQIFAAFWDGNNLWLTGFDFNGTLQWKRDLGAFTSQHGVGCSPMIFEGKVFLNNDQDGHAAIQAFDAKTGKTLWESPRRAFRACYSTPFLLERGGSTELIVTSTAGVAGYNPKDGRELWNWAWPFSGMALRTVASHVSQNGLIFLNSGDGSGERHMVAVEAGDNAKVAWETKSRNTPYVPSMLAWGDFLFYVTDKGFAGCQKMKTGEVVWHERLGGNFSASPVVIDGKIYAPNEEGSLYVFSAAPAFELLGKNEMGEGIMASPAVANQRLYVRGKEHLFCIGKPAGK